MAGCEFNPVAEVKAFASYKSRLGSEHPDWSPEFLYKQALIVFNTEMFPLQVKSYVAEIKGDLTNSTGQVFRIADGRLVNNHYDFQNMIDYATSKEEKNSMIDFQARALIAKPGEKIPVLDMSALGRGEGIKYLDIYEKESGDLVRHKERIDLTGDQPDLTIEQAKDFLAKLDAPDIPEVTKAAIETSTLPFLEPEIRVSFTQSPRRLDVESAGAVPILTGPMPIPISVVSDVQFVPEKAIPVTSASSFWFEVAVAAVTQDIVETTSRSDSEVPTRLPTRLDLEGTIDAFQPQWITDWGMIESLSPVQLPTQEVQKEKQKSTPATTTAPTRLDLEGLEGKPVITGDQIEEKITIFEAPVVKPEEAFKPLATTKQQLKVTVVEARCCFSETKTLEKSEIAAIVFESAAAAAVVAPTRVEPAEKLTKPSFEEIFLPRIIPEKRTMRLKKTYTLLDDRTKKCETLITTPVETVIRQKPEKQEVVIYHPIYQHNWQPAAIKEIPEWVWQGTAAGPDEIIDWSWFLVTMFYALLNTKILLNEKIS